MTWHWVQTIICLPLSIYQFKDICNVRAKITYKIHLANPGEVINTQKVELLQITKFERRWNHNQKCVATSDGWNAQKSKTATRSTADNRQNKKKQNTRAIDSNHHTKWRQRNWQTQPNTQKYQKYILFLCWLIVSTRTLPSPYRKRLFDALLAGNWHLTYKVENFDHLQFILLFPVYKKWQTIKFNIYIFNSEWLNS